MKAIVHLAFKDLTLVRRDWLGLFFIVGFPICMGLFFGAFGLGMSSDTKELPLAVIDEDSSDRSKQFIELLQSDGGIKVEMVEKELALEQVKKGERAAVLIVPSGFGETAGLIWAENPPALQLGTDPSRQAESGMIEGYIMRAMGQMTMERFQDVDSLRPTIESSLSQIDESDMPIAQKLLLQGMMGSLDEFLDSLEQVQNEEQDEEFAEGMPSFQLANIEPIRFGNESTQRDDQDGATGSQDESETDNSNEPKQEESFVSLVQSPWDLSFPSAMLWGVLGCVAGFAISIVRERTHGTLTRLQIAPISRAQILLGKALACYLAVVGVVVIMTTVGCALGMRPKNPAMMVVVTLCIAYCYVGIMMTMSVIGKSEEAVAGATWGCNIFAAMFGGGMVPLAFMPDFMRPISNISPVKWSILSLEGAIWREFTWMDVLFPCCVLIGIGAVGMTVGWAILSRE